MAQSRERIFEVRESGERIAGEVLRRKRGELEVRTGKGTIRYLRESDVDDLTAAVERIMES